MPSPWSPIFFPGDRTGIDSSQGGTGSFLLGHKYETNLYLSCECETNLYEVSAWAAKMDSLREFFNVWTQGDEQHLVPLLGKEGWDKELETPTHHDKLKLFKM